MEIEFDTRLLYFDVNVNTRLLYFYVNVTSTLKTALILVFSAVHTCLQDLMQPSTYFRLNPFMSEDFFLDEIRPDKLDRLEADTRTYLLTNERKLEAVASQLLLTPTTAQRLKNEVGQRSHVIMEKLRVR